MIKGEVQATNSKESNGKTFYSVKVNDVWYGLGMSAPTFAKGALIQFEEKQNDKGFWNANSKTLQVLGVVKRDSAAGPAASNDSSWDEKRNLGIEYQTAIKAASEIVSAGITAGALPAADAAESIIELAQRLFKSMQDRKVAKPVAAPKPVQVAKPTRPKPAPVVEEFVEDEEQGDEDDMDPFA